MRVCPAYTDLQSRRGGEAYKAQRVRRRWSWRQGQRRCVCQSGRLNFAVALGREVCKCKVRCGAGHEVGAETVCMFARLF